MDDVSAGRVDGELECFIAVVGLAMPGDFSVVDIGSPDGDFHSVDVSGFDSLHGSDKDDVFFAVLFSIGFDPSDFKGVDTIINGGDAHASCVDVLVGKIGSMGVDPVPFADFLGVVDDAEDFSCIIIDNIVDEGVVCFFLELGDMDDFSGKEVFFDGGSLGEEPSDDEGDASLVFPLDEQTVSLPVMD